jgi:2-isopropylmalate synthase
MSTPRVTIYDTTLRDGTQGTGISFSVLDKIRVAEKLDEFGVHYIEGGFPGSNPKDAEFFREAKKREWKHAKIAAFGATRRGKIKVEDDPQVRILLEAETPVVTIVVKTWPLQVTEVLGVSLDENLAMISDTVAFLRRHGREVLYDAEHFFDSYRDDPCVLACYAEGRTWGWRGSRRIVRYELAARFRNSSRRPPAMCSQPLVPAPLAFTRTTTAVLESLMPSLPSRRVRCSCKVRQWLWRRVGNCNLITAAAILQLKLDIPVVSDLTRLRELSHFVDELANVPHDIRAPYVGVAAFTHKGGQHVHAVQKLASSYEHIDPALVGNARVITISDMSGQSNVIVKARNSALSCPRVRPKSARSSPR